ncbi:cis-2,3-dihydrobiphenyl-2,3-diol dehydrogenase [Streptomyces albus subsp. albus]|nr:cis-2,3-dihydrobiphenyl-2,3-diol dehydrogenase [Streptomyces albus subsp. albus]
MTSQGRLTGQVALVTGGGSGIGRAVVRRYLAEGARVAVLERDPRRADELRAEAGAERLRVTLGDVRRAEDHVRAVRGAVRAFGHLDTYVANAGIYDYARPLADLPPARLTAAHQEIMGVNVLGCLLGVQAALTALRTRRGQVIVTASSSSFFAGGGGVLYVAAKHALVGVVRQLAHELAPDVRVNAVAPGATSTPLAGLAALGEQDRRLDASRSFPRRAAADIPLGRVSDPDDHTGLYVLLADRRDSGFMTGTVLPSDGGLQARAPRRAAPGPERAG